MQDIISVVINRYNVKGQYLDHLAMNELNEYFINAIDRIKISEFINAQASKIIKETSVQLYEEQPELLRPGGNSYTTRRYSACLRDIEYYLRYSSYAIIAGHPNILDERVLDGLKDTYNSLEIPLSPTIRSIELLKEVIEESISTNNIVLNNNNILDEPFKYLIKGLI
jgi:phycobilisome core component|uniref:Allophycocyanin beta-18 subunit n=1 Tax=Thorea hispida TaxID=202687 RepID=A0A1C9CAF0_9FLOR|nr:Allophycocyanin beta 18 subunit [Thorea hispida]AOM65363.1 Allophycocyanin beta 18 subunit [Thorea hispida]ARX95925.1 allophycocyanin beta-18 subunit [Thorea hispida]